MTDAADLAVFLRRQYDEEAKRWQTLWLKWQGNKRITGGWDGWGDVGYAVSAILDTTRGGRDLAAKRAILALHSTPHTVVDGWCVECGGECTHEGEDRCARCGYDDGCPTARHLVAPYAGRPGWNDAWRLA